MIQINANTIGDPATDPVELVIDTGHRYPGQKDLPGRMVFKTTQVEPSPYGAHIEWRGQILAYLTVPADGGTYEAANIGMMPPVLTFQAQPVALPTIVGDHFEVNGARWVWRMADGFCDHALLFTGNVQQVRDCYKQSQDLDVRGRRIFGMMKNITLFDPRSDYPRFWDTCDQLLDIGTEFGQPLNYVVNADAQILGMDLGWCQAHWAQFCQRYSGRMFITLVNQWNHDGNLVGRPNDYPNPGGLASQGSANEDTNPPNPTDGTGTGYQFWEWCSAQDPTHWSHEYYIQKGLSVGRSLPCVISEPGRRLEEGTIDLDYVRRLTHASMANGMGLTIHSTAGKYSQLLGPNTANAVRLAMSLLANGQA